MLIIKEPGKFQNVMRRIKINNSIGFVPTMGALHEGHLSLIRRARRENDIVAVSIFVNPAQFGPREDLKKYPRPLARDLKLCGKEKVDFVFLPSAEDIYPKGYSTFVEVNSLSGVLCGRSRPGHFKGVSTVVNKLLNIVGPDTLYLGRKDAQQATVIRRMVLDLNIPVKVRVMPIIRDNTGLALSSRNAYLNDGERNEALVLSQALKLAESLIKKGARDPIKVILKMRRLIAMKKTAKIDYAEIVDRESLKPVSKIQGNCLVMLAVFIGRTRLIDNLEINMTDLLGSPGRKGG